MPVTDCEAGVEKFERLMYQSAKFKLNNHKQDVEDAVSEARLEFLERCLAGDFEDRGMGAFLLAQVWGQCTAINRIKKRELSLEAESAGGRAMEEILADPDLVLDPEEILLKNLFSDPLARCLEELTAEQRRAVLCVYAPSHNRRYQEAAALLGITSGAVANRIFDSRRLLRHCLEIGGYTA